MVTLRAFSHLRWCLPSHWNLLLILSLDLSVLHIIYHDTDYHDIVFRLTQGCLLFVCPCVPYLSSLLAWPWPLTTAVASILGTLFAPLLCQLQFPESPYPPSWFSPLFGWSTSCGSCLGKNVWELNLKKKERESSQVWKYFHSTVIEIWVDINPD